MSFPESQNSGGGWTPDMIAICVPVRNEAALLPNFFEALQRQSLPPAMLCIAFDACIDGSEAIAARLAPALPFSLVARRLDDIDSSNAGRARRAAMALAERETVGHHRVALLTTDADSRPAPDWIATSIYALRGADVAAGRIVRDRVHRAPAQDRLEIYLDRLFALRRQLDPVPWEATATHHYSAGASLAFRDESYAALGGFTPHPAGEDAQIIDEAHRAGMRVRRDAAIVVETSSRRFGRVVGGLACHLRSLDASDGPAIRVAHPADAAWQYAGHALARKSFGTTDRTMLMALADRIGMMPNRVLEVASRSPNAEAFASRIVPGSPAGERLIGLPEAERALDELMGRRNEAAA